MPRGHYRRVHHWLQHGHAALGGTRVGYTGWVIRGAIPGTYRPLESGVPDSEAGPGSPSRAGVGGLGCSARPSPRTHPPGPVGTPAGSLPGSGPLPASWPIGARFNLISYKVSQKGIESPEKHEKACHSPCFQNRPGKSPLGFLGFPLFLAFSHKELMGQNDV